MAAGCGCWGMSSIDCRSVQSAPMICSGRISLRSSSITKVSSQGDGGRTAPFPSWPRRRRRRAPSPQCGSATLCHSPQSVTPTCGGGDYYDVIFGCVHTRIRLPNQRRSKRRFGGRRKCRSRTIELNCSTPQRVSVVQSCAPTEPRRRRRNLHTMRGTTAAVAMSTSRGRAPGRIARDTSTPRPAANGLTAQDIPPTPRQ
jgi:hypothetical protein